MVAIRVSEPLFYKANGQDLQDGYTIATLNHHNLKATAEKRSSDGMVQISIIPQDSHIRYALQEAEVCHMGGEWKRGHPLAKLYGRTTVVDGNSTIIDSTVYSVLLKDVAEFSKSLSEIKELEGAHAVEMTPNR